MAIWTNAHGVSTDKTVLRRCPQTEAAVKLAVSHSNAHGVSTDNCFKALPHRQKQQSNLLSHTVTVHSHLAMTLQCSASINDPTTFHIWQGSHYNTNFMFEVTGMALLGRDALVSHTQSLTSRPSTGSNICMALLGRDALVSHTQGGCNIPRPSTGSIICSDWVSTTSLSIVRPWQPYLD